MKLPCVIDMDIPGAKTFVQKAIDTYGTSRDINELAITVRCVDEAGKPFEIVQFHNSRSLVHFLSGAARA